MTNKQRGYVALLLLALAGILVATVLPRGTSVSTIEAVDTTTSSSVQSPATTATVPETTTVVDTTTTVAPPATTVESTTTTAPAPEPTTAPALQAQEEQPGGINGPVGQGDPAPAVKTESGKCLADEATCNPPTTPPRAEWRYCEEWHELAAEVGWPEDAGPTLSYVMHRESGCDPNARNRSSGAAGLLQLLGHNCNGSCFDPENNLRTGLALYHGRHWCDWYLRGDPVTGHACG